MVQGQILVTLILSIVSCKDLNVFQHDKNVQEEVITSFGRMKTSVWRVIEAVMQVTLPQN